MFCVIWAFGNFPYILFSVIFITTNVFNNFREYINAKLDNGNVSESKSLDLLKNGRKDLHIKFLEWHFFSSQQISSGNFIFIKSFSAG